MKGIIETLVLFLLGDAYAHADSVVPKHGFTARLTVISAATMAFLATIALCFSLSAGRLAAHWSGELARSATIRISTTSGQHAAQTSAVLDILETTRGVHSFRVIGPDEQKQLLAPWFGADLDVAALPIPVLVEVIETPAGIDADNLRLRLVADAPGAIFDTHQRWRKPLVQAAKRLRLLGWTALLSILGTMAIIVSLAAQSALAANRQVISVLRLVGARDNYIKLAFVRRFTIRSFVGAIMGVIIALLAVFLISPIATNDPILLANGFGATGRVWTVIWSFLIPLLSAIIAYYATKRAALHILDQLP